MTSNNQKIINNPTVNSHFSPLESNSLLILNDNQIETNNQPDAFQDQYLEIQEEHCNNFNQEYEEEYQLTDYSSNSSSNEGSYIFEWVNFSQLKSARQR